MRGNVLAAIVLMLSGCMTNITKEEAQTRIIPGEAGATFEEYCASTPQPPCRQNVSFPLTTDDKGNAQTFSFDLFPPPLQNGQLTILPGETSFLYGEFIGGVLVNPQFSEHQPKGKPYLKFSFTQMEGKPDMMLSVQNTYELPVKYRLVFMPPDSENLFKTSSCPVGAGMGAFEHWPHPIFQLMVIEVWEMEGDSSMVCQW